MKQIGDPKTVTAANALGHDSTCVHTHYVIEQHDVGITRQHHLGYNHSSHQFRQEDVGRSIDVMTDGSGWTCWSFGAFS